MADAKKLEDFATGLRESFKTSRKKKVKKDKSDFPPTAHRYSGVDKRGTGRTGRTGLTKKGKQKIEQVGRGALEGAQSMLAGASGRAKALAKKEAKKKDDMRWKTGTKSETVELKRGGTVRGAGLAQRGVHKVKHF